MIHSRVLMFKRLMNLYQILVWVILGTACGVAEPVAPAPAPVTAGTDVYLVPDTRIIERLVPRRATLASLLVVHELDNAVAVELIEAVRAVFDPRRLRVSNPYRFFTLSLGFFMTMPVWVQAEREKKVVMRLGA